MRNEKEYKNVPDKWNLVYILMVFFGIGSLLPFSATTTAIEYFNKNVSLLKFIQLISIITAIVD